MPLFDIKCMNGHFTLDVWQSSDEPTKPCGTCGAPTRKYHGLSPPHVHIFKEGFYEHLDGKPVYVRTKRQLKRELDSRGLAMEYAES